MVDCRACNALDGRHRRAHGIELVGYTKYIQSKDNKGPTFDALHEVHNHCTAALVRLKTETDETIHKIQDIIVHPLRPGKSQSVLFTRQLKTYTSSFAQCH